MKILFLNGSPRKAGYTAALMKAVQAGLKEEHSVDWVDTTDLNIKPCHACMECRPDQRCRLPEDDGHRVWDLIRSADAIIMGSPTYFGNISGPLKTLIDRCLTAFEKIAANGMEMPFPLHSGQKAIIVTACNAPSPISHLPNQSKGALSAMETVLKAGGYDIIGSLLFDGAAARKNIPPDIIEKAKKIGAEL